MHWECGPRSHRTCYILPLVSRWGKVPSSWVSPSLIEVVSEPRLTSLEHTHNNPITHNLSLTPPLPLLSSLSYLGLRTPWQVDRCSYPHLKGSHPCFLLRRSPVLHQIIGCMAERFPEISTGVVASCLGYTFMLHEEIETCQGRVSLVRSRTGVGGKCVLAL